MQIELQAAVYSLGYVRSAAFIADNDLYVSYSKWYDRNGMPLWMTADSRQQIRDEIGDPQRRKITAAYDLLEGMQQSDPVVLIGMPVRDLYTKERSGLLLYAVSTQMLLYQQGAASNEGVETVVTGPGGEILNGQTAGVSAGVFVLSAGGIQRQKLLQDRPGDRGQRLDRLLHCGRRYTEAGGPELQSSAASAHDRDHGCILYCGHAFYRPLHP